MPEFFDSFRQIHAAFPHFWTVVFFIFGAIVGSFLNVCILRIPRGESIISPGSHCACGAPIKLWNNIPILSWFILRGRAACCGRKFSIRYTLVETATAAIFAICWEAFPPLFAAGTMIFAALAIVLALQDFDSLELPDSVLAVFIIAGIFSGIFLTGMQENWLGNAIFMLVGLAAGTTILTFIRFFFSVILRREAMGEGDIFLAAGIGAFFGWQAVIFALLFGSILGLIFFAIAKICSRFNPRSRDLSEDDDVPPDPSVLPFGPPLLLAAFLFPFLEYSPIEIALFPIFS